MLLTLLSTARTLRMAYDRAAEVGRQEPAGASQNAERQYRINTDLTLLNGFTAKLVGTDKCRPNSWLVPSNAKLVSTFQCRPNRWLVPSN